MVQQMLRYNNVTLRFASTGPRCADKPLVMARAGNLLHMSHSLAGVVRGAARQARGAKCNLVSYWVIGIPLAVVLAFKLQMGVAGLWLGLLIATTIQGTLPTSSLFAEACSGSLLPSNVFRLPFASIARSLKVVL